MELIDTYLIKFPKVNNLSIWSILAHDGKWKKKMLMFGQAMCIRISLVQTDACNIISQSIFTGISLQPLHYSIQRGKQLSTMTSGTLMESHSVTVMTKTRTWCLQLWCSTETGLVLFRGIRGHRNLTLFPLRSPFPLRHQDGDIWYLILLLQPSYLKKSQDVLGLKW